MRIHKHLHAELPVSLYAKLIEIALNRALNGDYDAAGWLVEEMNVRLTEFRRTEYQAFRRKFKKNYCGKQCALCGEQADTIDHIVPLSHGGTNNVSNLQPLCRICNSKKSDR